MVKQLLNVAAEALLESVVAKALLVSAGVNAGSNVIDVGLAWIVGPNVEAVVITSETV